MKKQILFSLAVLLMSVIGCSKPDNGGKDNPQPPTPSQEQITIPSTVDVTPVVPPEGGDAKITFTAASAWTASVISTKADSWVDVNPKSGNPGPAEIRITTTPNDTYVERNATVQIKCGSKTKDIVLTQKQVDNITVTTDKVEIGAEGGTFTIELKSNIDFSYEIDGDWIKYVSTKAYTDKTLTFSAEPNESVEKREGNVTVKGGGFSEKIKVYQSGEEPTLVISQNEYELEAEGGSIVVEVSSNVSVIMTIPDSAGWITENETKSVSTSTFHLDVAANETYEARSAEITFSNEESGLSEKITVNQNGKTFVHVTSVTLDKNELTLTEGEKATLVATVSPEDATDKSVEWSSDKPEVASVDENGEVTAKSAGTATITVTTKDGGKTATCTVTIDSKFRPVTSITLDKTSAFLKAGETVTLNATVNPDDATDKTVTWTTTDATVATVDNGVVTAKKVGTATITAKAGDKTATCEITVVATPVTSVTLDQTSASLKAGETITLTATVSPDDATDKTVTWSTTDATVATVDNGVVTAKKVGTATITAKAGDKTATCEITVEPILVTSVSLDKSKITLIENEKATLVATVAPEDATDKSVEWSSDNPDVASVDDKGEVTAKTAGTATVTVTTRDGEKTAVCVVTVGWREADFHHRSLIMWLASTAYTVCTWMAEAVEIVKEEHSDKIEAIAMHEKSSSLYFDGVNLMISRFQPDRIPMALLDCRKEVICEPQERIAADMLFEAAQETEDNYKAVTGISFNSAINGNTLDVDVSVYAKVAEDFKIAVVLLEDGIVANQDGVGPRYVHYDVPRLNLSSSMEGDPFTVSQAGTVVPLHFSGIIPDKCVKRNCRILVYIQRKYGSQKVIQTRGYGEWYVDNCVSGRAGSSVPLVLDSGGSEYLGGNEDITSGDDINF